MQVLCIVVSLVVAIKAILSDYHEEVGIPLAARIKEYEDKVFAEGPEVEPRIWGGVLSHNLGYPYVASLLIPLGNRTSMCASSLVKADRLVTAGHCLYGSSGPPIRARVGSTWVYYRGTEIETTSYLVHPDYNHTHSRNHDVGIVRLPEEVELTPKVQVIDVPWFKGDDSDAEMVGEFAWTAGWGQWSAKEPHMTLRLQLHDTSLRIIMDTVCEDQYNVHSMHGNIVCADGVGLQRGLCEGDSGAPLVVERNGRHVLVGVGSFGHNKCYVGYPSVYMRVKTYIIFIMGAQ